MSEVIYKYKLEITDKQTLKIPGFFCFLRSIVQDGELYIYAIVDPKKKSEEIEILIAGTGNHLPNDIPNNCIYLDTAPMGCLIWHIFYKYRENA